MVIDPNRNTTVEIASRIVDLSEDLNFKLNLIDPLSAENQVNTSTSTLQDLNRIFHEFRRQGKGTGGYWTTWDTKSLRGREEIKRRLKNSRLVGKPFCNNGLPTIWISSRCANTIESFKNWRLEEWQNRSHLETKEIKEKPQQKWSHMMMCLEAILKHPNFEVRNSKIFGGYHERHTYGQRHDRLQAAARSGR
jgi:hypothetical protein